MVFLTVLYRGSAQVINLGKININIPHPGFCNHMSKNIIEWKNNFVLNMQNVNTEEHPEHSEYSNIWNIVHVIELSQPFCSTINMQPFLYRNNSSLE